MKLIAIDLDGTTLNENGVINPITIKVIRHLSYLGHKIIITTGRPNAISIDFYNQLKLNTPMINFNGALIYKPRSKWRLEKSSQLSYEIVYDILKLKNKYKIDLIVAEGKDFILGDRPYKNIPYLNDNINPINLLTIHNLKKRPISLSIFASPDVLNSISKIIQNKYSNLLINSWGDWKNQAIEIISTDARKSLAVRYVANYYNINLSDVIAFGDGDNDLDMLNDAGLGIAMKNSNDNVKKIADLQTKFTNKNDGLAYFLIDYFNLEI